MRENDIVYRVKAALTFAARGGLKQGLFEDTPEDDAIMLVNSGVLPDIPNSQITVVVRAIKEWRSDHEWLRFMPDNTDEEHTKT